MTMDVLVHPIHISIYICHMIIVLNCSLVHYVRVCIWLEDKLEAFGSAHGLSWVPVSGLWLSNCALLFNYLMQLFSYML